MRNERKILKIADFGTVREIATGLTTNRGTVLYMAPEVFESDSNYTTKCDVYSFGITLCEMFTGQRPYSTEKEKNISETEFKRRISQINSPLRPKFTSDVPEKFTSLIER